MAELTDFLKGLGEPSFRPEPWYNEAGDCIEFSFEPDEFFAERVDGILTVYRSFESKEIVGLQIKGIQAVCRKLKKLHAVYSEPNFKLILTIGAVIGEEEDPASPIYKDVIDRFGETKVPAELVSACA